MTLQELIEKHFGKDVEKTNAFLEDMKASKIFTTNEENLDIRYGKLKGNYDALVTKEKEAQQLIEQLKGASKGNEDMQTKITQYENTIKDLEAKNQASQIDNAIKFELLAKGAKASDIDYLMFKAKQGDELKLDKDGNVKGIDDLIDGLKKSCASYFEESKKKQVDVKELPNEDPTKDTMTKEEFLKKPYSERAQFAADNPEAFQEMMNK